MIEKTLNPEWEQVLTFALAEKPGIENLVIKVFDKDAYSTDDPMGDCILNLDMLSEMEPGEEREFTLALENVETGQIVLGVCYRLA